MLRSPSPVLKNTPIHRVDAAGIKGSRIYKGSFFDRLVPRQDRGWMSAENMCEKIGIDGPILFCRHIHYDRADELADPHLNACLF